MGTRRHWVVRLAGGSVLCCALVGCNGGKVKQAERMNDFEATQQDFDSIARAAFKMIETKGEVTTIVVPKGLGARALDALHHCIRS